MTDDEKFRIAIDFVLSHEGGLIIIGGDPNGISNLGITLRFLKTINPQAEAIDIIELTRQEAEIIYKQYWWDLYGYNRIDDIRIAAHILDMAVNSGGFEAHIIAQRVANKISSLPVFLNGSFDSLTVDAINTCYAPRYLAAYKRAVLEFYNDLVARDSSLEEYLNSWIARASDEIKT